MPSAVNEFLAELDLRSRWVRDYILDPRFLERFHPEDVRWAVTAYVRYGGKRLRPAILLFACGAVGGDEQTALPAAAAVEIFHTWTLVHDDIIDRDATRRGNDTVHHHYGRPEVLKSSGLELSGDEAHHYGASVAILTGDIQHGWGISMMTELTTANGVDPAITLSLINELDTRVLNTLVEGEVLDIQFARRDIDSLTPEMIEDMLWKKTGALYEFCGRAGAAIGLGQHDHPWVDAVANFAAKCGTAFQLQDDILGIIGQEETLGKPVGSDLREGKRTLVLYHAWKNASFAQRRRLKEVLGNPDASPDDIGAAAQMLRELGGIDAVAARARQLTAQAVEHLNTLPPTPYRNLLHQWADYLVSRRF